MTADKLVEELANLVTSEEREAVREDYDDGSGDDPGDDAEALDNLIRQAREVRAAAKPDPGDARWIERAREQYGEEGSVEIDDGAVVSISDAVGGGDGGAYVAAWVYVEAEEKEPDDACPGCGCLPGEGLTPGCTDLLGCGRPGPVEAVS